MNEDLFSRAGEWGHKALSMVKHQKTLVLSTCIDNQPWAAPVYYVYWSPSLCFFSSPRSNHIKQGLNNPLNAAAVFSEADEWDRIEGVQMVGRIHAIEKKMEQIKVTHLYSQKFPFAVKLLEGYDRAVAALKNKVKLYAFHPDRIYYMNNQMGFGSRMELKPPSSL